MATFGGQIDEARGTGKLRFRKALEFMNKWAFGLGVETLIPKGECHAGRTDPALA
jgi:hypothetical protein